MRKHRPQVSHIKALKLFAAKVQKQIGMMDVQVRALLPVGKNSVSIRAVDERNQTAIKIKIPLVIFLRSEPAFHQLLEWQTATQLKWSLLHERNCP